MKKLKAMLDAQYKLKNTSKELSMQNPDPLLVAKNYQHTSYFAEIALICALLSYGNAKAIVQMLQKLDFSLLCSRTKIRYEAFPYYRFQTSADIRHIFEAIACMLENGGLLTYFLQAYKNPPAHFTLWYQSGNKNHARILYGIYHCIDSLYSFVRENSVSKGLHFAFGTSYSAYMNTYGAFPTGACALKRWNMLLRWLVRQDEIDIGCWQEHIQPSHLILPLDTHTFRICLKLKILKRKSYDLQSALQATDTLCMLNPNDPISYDFALYRIGQSKQNMYEDLFI
ncbi:TIGR02757 family protein [Helicobacter sp. MIT 21-1697]|uniref:TIGR02757 family protein n=1 Tax=Helicobacter sp. MIT 21-1697 TaxID=2993733 RepID=UPI00224AE48A|nr:TIGR02757 family protein [Helicobacter sp. MIT 21-1697]MCX2717183.1 TIGR02757 family protein [Helicobacter sp. MIT 21-1697]